MPIRPEDDKLYASGILDVLRRFGTCRDHSWGSSLLAALVAQSIAGPPINASSFRRTSDRLRRESDSHGRQLWISRSLYPRRKTVILLTTITGRLDSW